MSGYIDFVPEEGSLATGKLFFKKGEDREKVLSKIMLLQRANLGRAWLMRSTQTILKSPRELLILASILEKENVAIILAQSKNEIAKAKNYIYGFYKNLKDLQEISSRFDKIRVKNSNSLIYKLITNEK